MGATLNTTSYECYHWSTHLSDQNNFQLENKSFISVYCCTWQYLWCDLFFICLWLWEGSQTLCSLQTRSCWIILWLLFVKEMLMWNMVIKTLIKVIKHWVGLILRNTESVWICVWIHMQLLNHVTNIVIIGGLIYWLNI